MDLPWQNIQGFSGAAAIGAIVLVDLALISNAFADNLFPVIEIYSQTPTWAIVVAVPLLSLAYLVGLLAIGAGDALIRLLRPARTNVLIADDIALAAASDSIVGRYQQLRQEAELLAGSTIAFALLAVGAGLSAWRVTGWQRFLTAVAIASMAFTAGSIALARSRHDLAHGLADAVRAQDAKPKRVSV
jgi:hypothetical protein